MPAFRGPGYVVIVMLLAGLSYQAAAQETQFDISARLGLGWDDIDHVQAAGHPGGSRRIFRGSGNNWGTSLLDISGNHSFGQFDSVGTLKALFLVESGFDANARQFNGKTVFNRRAYVGLDSSRYGRFIIGKNLSISNDGWYIDPFYQQYIGYETLVRGRSWQGVSNMLGYQTPTWAGWTAEIQLGLGSRTGRFDAQRNQGLAINYTGSRLTYYAVYDQRHGPDGRYTGLFQYSKEWLTGAMLHFKHWDLYAGYTHLEAPQALSVAAGGDGYALANHYWLGAQWWPTTNWRLQAAVYHVDVNHGGSANLPVLGTTYNLSKKLFLYASYGQVSNSALADFSAEATDNRPPRGQRQNAVYFGLVLQLDGLVHYQSRP